MRVALVALVALAALAAGAAAAGIVGTPQAVPLPTQSAIYGDLSGVYPTCCQEPAPPSGVDVPTGVVPGIGGPLSSCALPVLRVGADGRITGIDCPEDPDGPVHGPLEPLPVSSGGSTGPLVGSTLLVSTSDGRVEERAQLPTRSGGTGDPVHGDEPTGVMPGIRTGTLCAAVPTFRVDAAGRIVDIGCQEPAPPVSPPPPPRMDILTFVGTFAVVLWTLVPLGLVVAALVGVVNLTAGKRKRYLIRLDPLLKLLGDLDAEHQANDERRRALVEERNAVAAELLSQPKYAAADYWAEDVPLDILGLNPWTMLNVVLPAIEAHSPQFEFRITTPWWQRALGQTSVEVVRRRDCREARPVATMRPLAVHWTALEVTHAAGCASLFVAPAAPAVSMLP